MPTLKIDLSGQVGIIDDQEPFQLPPNAWSEGRNLRFNDGKAIKFTGHEDFIDPPSNWDGGDKDLVYHLLPIAEGSEYYWMFMGLNDVRVWRASDKTQNEITPAGADYTAADSTVDWTSCIIGGVPVINNGVDTPQYWPKTTGVLVFTNKLADLTDFAANADKCGALRAYKNYLIAMDVTKSSIRYPSLVKWSDSSALGDVPASWDKDDATTDAGETELAGTRSDTNVGIILDGMQLRDSFIIYKDDSVWMMNFVGGTFVFDFRQILSAQGMLARRCVAEFEGKHFFVGQSDVFVHDGANFESVIDTKRRDALYEQIDSTYFDRTFVFANYTAAEMWICFVQSSSGDTWPNKAFVWNWRHNTWGERDLPSNTPYITGGIVDTSVASDLWSSYEGGTGTHDAANGPTLTDSTQSWTTNQFVDYWVYNTTTGAKGLITANDATTITATLDSGEWTTNDAYGIARYWGTPADLGSAIDVPWGDLGFKPSSQSPCMANDGIIYKGDSTNQFAGTSFRACAERWDIPIGEQDQFVRIKAVYPRLTGDAVDVYVGQQKAPGQTPTYQSRVTFTPGSDQKVDARVTGTHAAIKFETQGDAEWELSGYDIEFDVISKR